MTQNNKESNVLKRVQCENNDIKEPPNKKVKIAIGRNHDMDDLHKSSKNKEASMNQFLNLPSKNYNSNERAIQAINKNNLKNVKRVIIQFKSRDGNFAGDAVLLCWFFF